ncbi:MAG: ribonuclease P protein component [Bacteroidota bacterium]
MTGQGFKKWERITNEATIEHLFKKGTSLFEFPFKVFYSFDLPTPRKGSMEMAIAVPKKRLKHANDRNRVKRLVRESYRLNRLPVLEILEKNEKRMSLFLIYVGTADVNADQVRQKIIVLLNRLQPLVVSEQEPQDL